LSDRTAILVDFLDFDEAHRLKHFLNLESIEVSLQQMPDDRTDPYYQVIIKETDFQKANPILRKFKKELSIQQLSKKNTCPKCGAQDPFINRKKNLTLFEKIFSIGTQVMCCAKCGAKWYI